MWCRRGGSHSGGNKIRKPELSPMTREHKEKLKRIADSLSPPPSATSPVFNTNDQPPTPLQSEEDIPMPDSPMPDSPMPDSPMPDSSMLPEQTTMDSSSSTPLPESSTHSPPREASPQPQETEADIASVWVGSFDDGVRQLKMLLVKLKNKSKDLTAENKMYRIAVVKSFLRWLEYEVEMTPQIRDKHFVDQILALPEREDLRPTAPESIAATCRRLLDQYSEDKWGEDESMQPPADVELDISPPASPKRATRTVSPAPPTADMRLPAHDHPIWGKNGIMHAFALKPSGKINYIYDPRYLEKKRDAKVFGHNGFEPGMWWPYQRVAHFWGAHGAPMTGITGDPKKGAYSIVTSGSSGYDDMDQDFGDKLLYSADNSHDNNNPNEIAFTSNRTKSLHMSLKNGKPVRVLRSSGGTKAYTPKVGIRYDGLYRVAAVHKVKNKLGGLYEQFELIRLPGQRSLDEIQRNVPSRKQQADFAKIKDGY